MELPVRSEVVHTMLVIRMEADWAVQGVADQGDRICSHGRS